MIDRQCRGRERELRLERGGRKERRGEKAGRRKEGKKKKKKQKKLASLFLLVNKIILCPSIFLVDLPNPTQFFLTTPPPPPPTPSALQKRTARTRVCQQPRPSVRRDKSRDGLQHYLLNARIMQSWSAMRDPLLRNWSLYSRAGRPLLARTRGEARPARARMEAPAPPPALIS